MDQLKTAVIAMIAGILFFAGARFIVSKTPLNLDGPVWESLEQCAENQQNLYRSLEWYVEENGHVPSSMEDFKIDGMRADRKWCCPETEKSYVMFLENYGNPNAVLIADRENKHPTTFLLWLRGLKPHVQTMGDGTIYLFKGGKMMTMVGSSHRN